MNRCILLLLSSHHLMRIFGAIFPAQPLLVRAGQPQTPERRGVGAQLVGDQQFRHEALLFEQLADQPQRRPTVASALDQHVENLALVIHGTPQIHPLAGDAHRRKGGTAVLEYSLTEIIPLLSAMLPGPARLCRPSGEMRL